MVRAHGNGRREEEVTWLAIIFVEYAKYSEKLDLSENVFDETE